MPSRQWFSEVECHVTKKLTVFATIMIAWTKKYNLSKHFWS